MQEISSRRIAPILGALGALGPLSIDMYLPGMPQIASALGVGEGAVQFSLMSFFAGLMLGQLFYGPLSDRVGRKPVIYAALAIYVVASLGSATSSTALAFALWRFVQGLGGSIGMVIGLAVVRDLYTGRTAARLLSLFVIVIGVAPMLAPIVGSTVIAIWPWPALFATQALFGVICLALVWGLIPETRAQELRAATNPLDVLRRYAGLATSRLFIPYVASTALVQAGFFAYLAGSSFVFIQLFGLSPRAYSVVFAINGAGMIAGAQIAPRIMGRVTAQTIVKAAVVVFAAAGVLLAAFEMAGAASLPIVAVLLFVLVLSLAFVMPLNSVLALEAHGAIAGTAAALMGGIQYGAGTLATLVVGLAADGSARPMIFTIAACGVVALAVTWLGFPGRTTGTAAARAALAVEHDLRSS